MYVLPVAITFVSVATVAVALRLFTRIHVVYAAGWDDWTLSLALITDFAFFAFIVIEDDQGLGKWEHELPPEELRAQLKALWVSIPLYNLTLNLTKISMVLLYRRLFTTKTYRILSILVLIFVTCTGLWMILSALFFCIPINAFWDTRIEHTCLPRAAVWGLNAALQITTDLIVVILPMPQLAKLQMPLKQKVCLMFLFALGLFVCVTSAVRLQAIIKLLNSTDISRHNGPAATWSFIEANVAIICASLPTLGPLIARIFPRLTPSHIRGSYSPREKRSPQDQIMFWAAPFQGGDTSYSASVTGNCSASVEGLDPSSHRQPGAEGIQVVSELRWDLDSAHRANDHTSDHTPEQVNYHAAPTIQFM